MPPLHPLFRQFAIVQNRVGDGVRVFGLRHSFQNHPDFSTNGLHEDSHRLFPMTDRQKYGDELLERIEPPPLERGNLP